MATKENGFLPSSAPKELKKILKAMASQWGNMMEEFHVVPIKGGKTIEVFQINWPAKHGDLHRKVLVRIYPEVVRILFNRDDEIRTFGFMSKLGQGPRVLGQFPEGRIEEWFMPELSAADLRDSKISARIAAKLREFHDLDIPGATDVHFWWRLWSWLDQATIFCPSEYEKEFCLDLVGHEINILEKKLPHLNEEIGFCHHDLQHNNIMVDEETGAITPVGYDYASWNAVAYDLANHFCEMAADTQVNTEERGRFIYAYLASSGNEPSDDKVQKLLNDAQKYTLVSHLHWSLWGIISAYVNNIDYVSNIDFDYLEYAKQRFQQYWLGKPLLLGS